MTTPACIVACVLMLSPLASPIFAQATDDEQRVVSPFPETAPPHEVLIHPHRQQRDKYIYGTFGPPGMIDAAVSAAIGQWQNEPREWGQARQAYFKRFATEYTESSISQTTMYVLARLRDEDPSFRVCSCSGIHRRLKHAIISPFIAYDFDNGRPQFSLAKTGGKAASSFVSANTWKPNAPTTAGAQVAHLGVDMLGAIGVDLVREFILHRRKIY